MPPPGPPGPQAWPPWAYGPPPPDPGRTDSLLRRVAFFGSLASTLTLLGAQLLHAHAVDLWSLVTDADGWQLAVLVAVPGLVALAVGVTLVTRCRRGAPAHDLATGSLALGLALAALRLQRNRYPDTVESEWDDWAGDLTMLALVLSLIAALAVTGVSLAVGIRRHRRSGPTAVVPTGTAGAAWLAVVAVLVAAAEVLLTPWVLFSAAVDDPRDLPTSYVVLTGVLVAVALSLAAGAVMIGSGRPEVLTLGCVGVVAVSATLLLFNREYADSPKRLQEDLVLGDDALDYAVRFAGYSEALWAATGIGLVLLLIALTRTLSRVLLASGTHHGPGPGGPPSHGPPRQWHTPGPYGPPPGRPPGRPTGPPPGPPRGRPPAPRA